MYAPLFANNCIKYVEPADIILKINSARLQRHALIRHAWNTELKRARNACLPSGN